MEGEQDTLRRVLGEEAVEKTEKAEKAGFKPTRRRLFRDAAIVGAAATIPGFLAACSSGGGSSGGQGKFPSHPAWKFAFINHAFDNPFFVPTKYAIEDACALLGIPTATFEGAGTQNGNNQVPPMLDKMNAAIAAKVDGLAVALIDPTAFNDPTAKTLAAGIPVLSYNAHFTPGP